jgi:hypothetical protein
MDGIIILIKPPSAAPFVILRCPDVHRDATFDRKVAEAFRLPPTLKFTDHKGAPEGAAYY